MRSRPEKILALQFKYFGDAVLMTPALRAIRERFPEGEIHLLVPHEIAPLFQHLPWLTRVWAMPRRRGRAGLLETWPLIRALRGQRFDRSVDFASNDRGALLSFLIGARRRLGWDERGGFLGRRFLYTERAEPDGNPVHESLRLAKLLAPWQIPLSRSLAPEICADDSLSAAAGQILSEPDSILCHLASSQIKKEWPVAHWVALHCLAADSGLRLVFASGVGKREEQLLNQFKYLAPRAMTVSPIPDLGLYLAVLKRAAVFVSADTGPLHFAAGLGVPVVALFGPTDPRRWAPVGGTHRVLSAARCSCAGGVAVCQSAVPCMATILPERVLAEIRSVLTASR